MSVLNCFIEVSKKSAAIPASATRVFAALCTSIGFLAASSTTIQISTSLSARTPNQIDPTTRKRMEHMGQTFPYELKRQQLECRCTNSILETGDTRVAEHEYQKFMVRYGHRFSKDAA